MFDEIASVGLHDGPILVGRCLCPEFSGTKAESQKFQAAEDCDAALVYCCAHGCGGRECRGRRRDSSRNLT